MLSRRLFLKYLAVSLGLKWSLGHSADTANVITPEQFGAVGDGVTDDTLSIQAAIDSGYKNIYLTKRYAVSPIKHPGVPGIIGKDSVCLKLRSELRLYGDGEILLAEGSEGVSGAVLSNISTEGIRNCIVEVVVDGQNVGGQRGFSGIVFINANDCATTSKTKITNVTYNGIQFARGSHGCSCYGTTITNVGYIGIQAQNPINIAVEHCNIRKTRDNAIDFESNRGRQNGKIKDNKIIDCKAGVFLESGGNCFIENNNISLFKTAGIFLNRINTPADNVQIRNNTISGYGQTVQFGGIAINNAIKNVMIEGNIISGMKYGVWTNGGISDVTMNLNTFNDISESLLRIADGSNQLVKSKIRSQRYMGKIIDGKPTITNIDISRNKKSVYRVDIENMHFRE
ncbi:right-handed parallel beta-helix repeat-containing protein [Pectobacterium versatile]|uniref:right-handed parallel beta-helix repeat-containing protein n=1 Tax=Pectobacterium versatile TaxID=2488639 RepID=UPI001F2492E6|nr:right-handed parallel beta-helix repeat-containing protein [Pectobacterium versatile]